MTTNKLTINQDDTSWCEVIAKDGFRQVYHFHWYSLRRGVLSLHREGGVGATKVILTLDKHEIAHLYLGPDIFRRTLSETKVMRDPDDEIPKELRKMPHEDREITRYD